MTTSQTDLKRARAEFEQLWLSTRERLSGELGVQLRRSGWLLLLLAGAVGVATAAALRSSKTGRRAELPSASE